jgi:plasmid stabilization system protein ParE
MNRQIVKKPQALRDLALHFHYISLDSERAALRFIADAEKAFELISAMPGAGTA